MRRSLIALAAMGLAPRVDSSKPVPFVEDAD